MAEPKKFTPGPCTLEAQDREIERLQDQLVEERVAGFRLAQHELTYHARKDSTGDETKAAFHIAANWLSARAEELGAKRAADPSKESKEATHNSHSFNVGNISVPPRASRTSTAMARAEALAEAAGLAGIAADFLTVPFNPVLANLRYRLLLWAAITRDERLREHLPEYRRRARNAVACYRAIRSCRAAEGRG